MIYSVEAYYEKTFPGLEPDQRRERLSRDRVTMAMILASYSGGKIEVGYADFMAIARLADEFGCLSVYVDFYGRPVSYIIWGICDPSSPTESPEVRFGTPSTHLYVVDFSVREGSLDETLKLWLSERTEHFLTVRRSNRPKQYRSYALSRLKSFAWRTSMISNRFSAEKGPGLAEYGERAKATIETYQTIQSVLDAICHDERDPLDITRCVPLLCDLLSLQQLFITNHGEACTAVIVVALASPPGWRDLSTAEILTLPLRTFLEGTDLVMLELYGSVTSMEGLRASVLASLDDAGETHIFIRQRHDPDTPGYERVRVGRNGWQAMPSKSDSLIRLVRA